MKVENRKTLIRIIPILLAVAIAVVICQFRFDFIESFLFDARIRLKPTSNISNKIQTIAIDPKTVDSLKRVPNVRDHLELLKQLQIAQAEVVIYLLQPNELVGSYEELSAWANETLKFKHFHVAIPDVYMKSEEDKFKLSAPFEKINALQAPRTSDRTLFAKDDVTRRMITSYQGRLTLHPVVGALYNETIKDEKNIRGLFEFYEANQTYIDFHPTGTYQAQSFVETISQGLTEGSLKGKAVLIGRDIRSTVNDYIKTPFSRDVVAMSTLEMHANMLDTMILNSAPFSAPKWLDQVLTTIISILTLFVVLMLKPSKGLVILASSVLVFSIACFLTFWTTGLMIGMAHPFLSIFICYYFFIPYRLIMENRKSWEYYQKNKLLTQVEELKTNFLSMMSHDLKTPIARIQGMTSIVASDSNPLSSRQKEALATLDKSAEELLQFVSSILNLGRIESKELKLHLQSKDVNSLLEDVVSKLEYTAQQKQIEISTEFEPMFSMKMDVDLLRQVFSNLVENAIKYSPPKSKVLITTEDRNGKAVIQVADQGMGIPDDEIGHIFMKFYRSKNSKSSTIKGSGLGLYLAKYFVELHHGTIFVDSSLGQGSTFTVELPMDLTDET